MTIQPRILACACLALLALAMFGACDQLPSGSRQAKDRPTAEELDPLPPPIVPPADTADAAAAPSYEVAIATAAAERNRAKKKCAALQEIERTTCEAEADSMFATASGDLESLRGNQQ